jgi:hypothetical protein
MSLRRSQALVLVPIVRVVHYDMARVLLANQNIVIKTKIQTQIRLQSKGYKLQVPLLNVVPSAEVTLGVISLVCAFVLQVQVS